MKQSRELRISNKIVTSADLRRLGEIFQKQSSLAKKSEHHFSVEYSVGFADGTTITSDTSDTLDDDTLTAFPRASGSSENDLLQLFAQKECRCFANPRRVAAFEFLQTPEQGRALGHRAGNHQ
jgi:hypothetical protein